VVSSRRRADASQRLKGQELSSSGRRSDEQRVAREALTVAKELEGKERHFFLKRFRR